RSSVTAGQLLSAKTNRAPPTQQQTIPWRLAVGPNSTSFGTRSWVRRTRKLSRTEFRNSRRSTYQATSSRSDMSRFSGLSRTKRSLSRHG
ncbi:hypothetical protein CEP52_017872, partial [Fusarium oligoseptatum]